MAAIKTDVESDPIYEKKKKKKELQTKGSTLWLIVISVEKLNDQGEHEPILLHLEWIWIEGGAVVFVTVYMLICEYQSKHVWSLDMLLHSLLD